MKGMQADMNVIVLAGEKRGSRPINTDEAQHGFTKDSNDSSTCNDANGITNKAFLKIKNKYMIEYVIDTLKRCKSVERIAVVGPKARLAEIIGDRVDFISEGTDSIVDNSLLALEQFKEDREVLIVTSDIPMITVEAIEDFIDQSRRKNADLCYSIVDKKVNDERYPEVKRTYARLWEGQFTGGNVFYFNPAVKDKCKDFVGQMLEYRKSPAKMAGVLGFVFLLKLALGILTINAVQKKCEKLLGIKGAAIVSPYPEIGNDVDKLSDIKFVEKYLD